MIKNWNLRLMWAILSALHAGAGARSGQMIKAQSLYGSSIGHAKFSDYLNLFENRGLICIDGAGVKGKIYSLTVEGERLACILDEAVNDILEL